MEFPVFIDQDYKEMETWSRFIYKASRGSIEAVEILTWAELTFVAECLGKSTQDVGEQTTKEVEHEVEKLIPVEHPFDNLDDFLHRLYQWGCMPVVMPTRSDPFHEYEYYADLWGKSLKVSETELIFDAAAYSFSHWSWTQYHLLFDLAHQANFNSQDVVAAILFLITGRELSRSE